MINYLNMTFRPTTSEEIVILHEDDHILAVNKPPELLSVPGRELKDSVYSRLIGSYPGAEKHLIIHRLDMSTSGILLLAKTREAHYHIHQQFEERTVIKRYTAVLDGSIKSDEGLIDLPLRLDMENRPRQIVCFEHGKPSQTRYRVSSRYKDRTLVHFFPMTGRTHQLRVHAAHEKGLNTPIMGDDLYGREMDRLYLHADRLEFSHPHTRAKVIISCNPDF